MCSAAKKVIKAVTKLLKKIWTVVKKYLVYIVLIAVLFYPFLYPFITQTFPWLVGVLPTTGIWSLSGFSMEALAWRGIAGLAFAFLIDKDTATEIVSKVAEVVSDVTQGVIGGVGAIAGGVLSGAASGFASSPVVLIAGGLLLWYFLSDRDGEKTFVIDSPIS